MVRTLGIDHGTQGIRFCRLEGQDKRTLEIGRDKASEGSIIPLLEREKLLPVDLIGLTYSMADSIDRITDLRKVKNRGQTKELTGEFVGGGTRLFDEILDSGLRSVLIPGLHRNIGCLDKRFKILYSHMAASEKVALAYHSYNGVNKVKKVDNLIISDISSNTVTIGIKDRTFFGAMDACLGAPGLFHGPIDLESIRKIDAGKTTANTAFYSAGITQKTGLGPAEILKEKSDDAKLSLESLVLAVKMEVCGFSSVIQPDAIVVSGSAGVHKNVYKKLENDLKGLAPIFKLDHVAAGIGAAEIARDIILGADNFLGIGVDL
jgi:putative methanogenesis marker protein 12